MSIFLRLSTLALRGLVGGAVEAAGSERGAAHLEKVISFLGERFRDQSQRLEEALRTSNDRAWNALEVALAGDTLWKRMTTVFTRAEDRAFAEQVKLFLDATPLPELANQGHFRDRCLKELRQARKKLVEGRYDPAELARHAGNFARFADTTALIDAEWRTCLALAEEVRRQNLEGLAWLLGQKPVSGAPLLVVAVRYFFRRSIEEDSQLYRGLSFGKLDEIASAQAAHFRALADAIAQRGQALEEMLGGLHAGVVRVEVAVQGVNANVLDLKEMIQGQSDQVRQLGEAMLRALEQKAMDRGEVKPTHSLSIRDDRERRMVKALMEQYRALPDEQKDRMPSLLHALGKLGFASGDFREAIDDFQRVADLCEDPKAKAEAHFNAYRAALEEGLLDVAMKELVAAIRLDNRRWVPFPVGKYVPQKILGAGGFGVAFLCKHKYMDGQVVVKTLQAEGIDLSADRVFSEAQLLRQIDHPSIIRISDCGFVEPEERARPFIVMDYFDGKNLFDFVQHHGPLAVPDLLVVARATAEALRAAHSKNILHRDIKPANLLVRKDGPGWQVKVIDFGLALKQEVLDASTTRRGGSKTVIGRTIEGTLDYAAPEQMGKLPGVAVSLASDVYGFGRTCCYALFATPQPLPRHFRNLPDALVSLLEDCIEEMPDRRPKSFADVLTRLSKLEGSAPVPHVPAARPAPPAPVATVAPPPPPPPLAEWFYLRNGQQAGPVTQAAIRELLLARQMTAADLVWKAGMAGWVAASAVPGLVPDLPPPPPPTPAMPVIPVLELPDPEPVPVTPARVTPARSARAPEPVPVEVAGPDWLVEMKEFCEQTHRFWLSGKAHGFAPNYKDIARTQPKNAFLKDIRDMARFLEDNDYPFFLDEALIGSGQGMMLTSYRMVITTPQKRLLCIPLGVVDHYAFEGASGTWLGFFMGSDLKISGAWGDYHWSGDQLENLFFPTNEYVRGTIALEDWRRLPKAALRALSKTTTEIMEEWG